MARVNARFWTIKNNKEPVLVQKQGAEKYKYKFDVTPYLAGLAKTLSSCSAAVTAGTGTAPTVANAGAATISGNVATIRIDGGVAPAYNASGVVTNSGTAWNGADPTNPGQGTVTLTFTFSDASTLIVPIKVALVDPR